MPFTDLDVVSEDVVRNIMMKMSLKTCDPDPIPAALLLNCTDDVLPALTNVMSSLPTATVPKYLKKVIINPLLEKKKKKKASLQNSTQVCVFSPLDIWVTNIIDEKNR